MPILNVYVENAGQSGQIPRFVYIETNDTLIEVMKNGYLNSIVSQGIPLSESLMALVVTRPSQDSKTAQTSIFSILYSSGNWSLVSSTGSESNAWLLGGNSTDGPQIFGTTNNNPISFQANSIQYMQFDTTTQSLFINCSQMLIEVTSLVQINGPGGVVIDGTDGVTLANTNASNILIGRNPSTLSLDSSTIQLPNIPGSTNSNILYIDPTTFQLSYGVSPVFNTASDYTLTGNWQFNNGFNVNNSDVINMNSQGLSVSTTTSGISLVTSTSGITLSANSSVTINGGNVTIGATTSISMNTFSQDINLQAGNNISMYASNGGSSFGSYQGMSIFTAIGNIDINSGSNSIVMQSTTSGQSITLNADSINLTPATTLNIGNSSANLNLFGILPGSAPSGSLIVVWDPVSTQFFQSLSPPPS